MTSGPAWIYWAGGGTLAVFGLVIAYLALFHDRARGRTRCPKCWYDMSGSPGIRCSECGHEAKHPRGLRRTRRSWRLAVLAVLLLGPGIWATLMPRVKARGWVSLVPTTVLIATMPDAGATMQTELSSRALRGQLWVWQWRWLVTRCLGPSPNLVDVSFDMPSEWPEGSVVRARPLVTRVTTGFGWFDDKNVAVSVSSSWPEADACTFEIDGAWATMQLNGRPVVVWGDQMVRLGRPSEPSQPLTVTVEATIRVPMGINGQTEQVIAQIASHRLAPVIGGKVELLTRPVAKPVYDHLLADQTDARANEWQFHFRVYPDAVIRAIDNITLALSVDLLHGDTVVARGETWQRGDATQYWLSRDGSLPHDLRRQANARSTTSRRDGVGRGVFGGIWRENNIESHHAAVADGTWKLRLRPAPELAVCDPKANQHWSGQVELPLTWSAVREEFELISDPPTRAGEDKERTGDDGDEK